MDQSGWPLEIEARLICHCLILIRNVALFYRTKYKRNMRKDMEICHLWDIFPRNMGKKLLNTATETGLFAEKNYSKNCETKTCVQCE